MSKETFDVEAVASELQKHLEYKDGVVTVKDGTDLFAATLPEDVSAKQVKESLSYLTRYAEASALAFGNTSIDAMKKDKALEKVQGKFPIVGPHNVAFSLTRSASGPVPGKEGERWEKHGVLSVDLNIAGTKANRGGMSKVSQRLQDRAAEVLAGK